MCPQPPPAARCIYTLDEDEVLCPRIGAVSSPPRLGTVDWAWVSLPDSDSPGAAQGHKTQEVMLTLGEPRGQ